MNTSQQSALQAPEAGVLLSNVSAISGETRFDELVRRWPVVVSVLAAHLRRQSASTVTSDLPLRSIAAECGIPLASLLPFFRAMWIGEARSECVWTCSCR